MPLGVELGLMGTGWWRPACCVTWGKALLLSGPQKRSSHRLLFIVSTEGSLLKREKSEAGGVTCRDAGGLGPRIWRWEGLIPGGGRDTMGAGAGRESEEITEGTARGLPTMLSASSKAPLLSQEVLGGASWYY